MKCSCLRIVVIIDSFFIIFREEALSYLTDDRRVLNDFLGIHFDVISKTAVIQAHLVILLMNYTVLVFDAESETASDDILNILKTKDDVYGWCKCNDDVLVNDIASKLRGLDASQPLPPMGSNVGDVQESKGLKNSSSAAGKLLMQTKIPPQNPYIQHAAKKSSTYFNVNQGTSSSMVSSGDSKALGAIDMSKMKYKYDEKKFSEKAMGFKVKVSGVFPHYSKARMYARVFIVVPDGLYFLPGKFLRIPYDEVADELFIRQGKEIPLYIKSLGDLPTCIRSDRHNYKRSNANWTIGVIYFDVEFPMNMGSVEQYVSDALSTLASNYNEESDCGANFASWLKVNKSGLYNLETGVDGKKRKLNHTQFASTLQKRLVKGFANRSIEWNVSLDNHITYGHIKEWISDTLGYDHWHMLPQHVKPYVMSNIREPYPDWEETEVKPLSYQS